jgi:signal transduction histidine kinase
MLELEFRQHTRRVTVAPPGRIASALGPQIAQRDGPGLVHPRFGDAPAPANRTGTGSVKAHSDLASRIDDLILVLSKVNADKGLGVHVDVPTYLTVACEQQDLDEMLGNLLENAFQWGRSRLDIRARHEDRYVVVEIDDDGPGLAQYQLSHVMQPGERLDETMPGFGFGLSITRELAELYGGGLLLCNIPTGGLRASLRLPQTVNPNPTRPDFHQR